jgi:hypothetical protein
VAPAALDRGRIPARSYRRHPGRSLNLLGFTTQQPARLELATEALSLPRLIVGKQTIAHMRRPAAWRSPSETQGSSMFQTGKESSP